MGWNMKKKKDAQSDIWKLLIGLAGFLALFLVLLYGASFSARSRDQIIFAKNLDSVAVTVDGRQLRLSDLLFYVAYVESNVESKAKVYDAENTRNFWNIHVNGTFIQEDAKNSIIGMAIHDEIFYQEALQAGVVLTGDEKEQLEEAWTDFWSDMSEVQQEKMPASYEVVNHTIEKAALAEKYQEKLAEKMGVSFHKLDWNDAAFEEIKEEHEVRINTGVWERVVVGNITLQHGTPQYAPAPLKKDGK